MAKSLEEKIASLKGKLIVSCQALPNEPLHSSFIMGRMALAAQQGGASGIRANTKEDIAEIQQNVDLPIIGIVKRDYEDSIIYITPTMKEIDELMEIMKNLAAEGKSILFITHKLNEIMAVSDRCSVLCKGKYIGTVEIKNTSKEHSCKRCC